MKMTSCQDCDVAGAAPAGRCGAPLMCVTSYLDSGRGACAAECAMWHLLLTSQCFSYSYAKVNIAYQVTSFAAPAYIPTLGLTVSVNPQFSFLIFMDYLTFLTLKLEPWCVMSNMLLGMRHSSLIKRIYLIDGIPGILDQEWLVKNLLVCSPTQHLSSNSAHLGSDKNTFVQW